MDLYLSTFENRIDKKGRVSVPAPYRAVLERRDEPLYIFKHLTLPCLEGCGSERIEQIVDAIDEADSLSVDAQKLQTMLSSAQEMKLDSEGRIMLPSDFLEYAGLEGLAVYTGIGRSFNIWNPERHRKRDSETRDKIRESGVPKLRLGAKRHRPGEPDGRG